MERRNRSRLVGRPPGFLMRRTDRALGDVARQAFERARRAVASRPPRWRSYLESLSVAAIFGHSEAITALGAWYAEGLRARGKVILRRNPAVAAALFATAAASGDPLAMIHLAGCYERGIGVTRSSKNERLWYLRAARLGHPVAAYNLAVISRLAGGQRGYLRWLRRAADLGDADAVAELASSRGGSTGTRVARATRSRQ